MSTFEVLAVSSRKLCGDGFLTQLEKTARARPAWIILREKDLCEKDYTALARSVLEICGRYRVRCILHTFVGAAISLDCKAIHLPLAVLREKTGRLGFFETVGVSVHSPQEAAEAEGLGASYVTAGHIFATDCKKGLAPRGLSFLKSVAESVDIPVYAIGGMTPRNLKPAIENGARGVCVMSGFMCCANPVDYMREFESAFNES